ncbi:MAG: arginine--tRNA ligase [Methanocellales archaeon]|nr:arginine--tRNA ligase [Methanocellales archaeon]MDD3421044.1 arginine--tRNA ligase [Methanocellales archaeon]MDD4898790.1 arginine--tRNA ligase [Methanocellales archaeon]MDD5447256.1 arginine--tRNA ligase [Methanocellales archaeon]
MFLEFKNGVKSLLRGAVEAAGYEAEDLCLGMSAYADIASSVAFKLSSRYGEQPQIIATKIFKKIQIPKGSYVNKADVVGPYINFYVNRGFLEDTIKKISTEGENYGSLPKKDERIILEHTSVNPTGPLHVGRGRNPIIGDTLARILRRAGYEVDTQFYVNDMGRQIATIVWGYDKIDPNTLPKPARELGKPDHDVVRYYRRANELISEDPKVDIEVNGILAKYESGDPETIQIFKKVVENCMLGQRQTLERIDIYYDRFVWESQFVRDGSVGKILEKLKKTRYASLREGALTLDLREFGLEKDFVLTRSDGITLYTTRDIAYHLWKFDHADVVINVLGEDQKLAMSQLQTALKILGIEKEPKIVFYSFVSLPEGRMSTRDGIVVDLDDLLDEAFDRAYIEVQKRRPDLPENQKRKIAGIVGMGAVRFDTVKVAPEKMITFRWEEALDFEKQGAPFIQYAHARACSILSKASLEDFDPSLLKEPCEVELIKKMAFFPGIVASAAHDLKPNIVAIYARELAEKFNQFYLHIPVLKAEDDLRKARLALVECARIVLANVLNLLGIIAPESM